METVCQHLQTFAYKDPKVDYCEECIKTGDEWVHLRTCQTCGITLCCDSSPNKHARKHAKREGHAVIISAEPGEHWAYCFVDDQTIEI